MEAVGEVKGQSRYDDKDEDRGISHGNSVSTSDLAVEARDRTVRRSSSARQFLFT
jgi:hypothetical protein